MKLRCALAAASALSGLAMVLNATDAQADGMNQPPPPPQWGFQWESGVRYWYSTGNHQFINLFCAQTQGNSVQKQLMLSRFTLGIVANLAKSRVV